MRCARDAARLLAAVLFGPLVLWRQGARRRRPRSDGEGGGARSRDSGRRRAGGEASPAARRSSRAVARANRNRGSGFCSGRKPVSRIRADFGGGCGATWTRRLTVLVRNSVTRRGAGTREVPGTPAEVRIPPRAEFAPGEAPDEARWKRRGLAVAVPAGSLFASITPAPGIDPFRGAIFAPKGRTVVLETSSASAAVLAGLVRARRRSPSTCPCEGRRLNCPLTSRPHHGTLHPSSSRAPGGDDLHQHALAVRCVGKPSHRPDRPRDGAPGSTTISSPPGNLTPGRSAA
jgi:hypothetical protein